MTRKEFPGGWYADALPSGEYAVIYHDARGYMDTHRGSVKFAPEGRKPLFPRITNIHGFKVAGQFGANDTPEWIDGRGWVTHLATAIGVSPVIYDNDGALQISNGSIGSQGWRYVERGTGRLITGDATYGPKGAMRLWEWTDLGDGLFVGQGAQGGVALWDGLNHRRVATGVCRFIRAHREDGNVSIAYWREDGPSACLWMTVAELKASPVIPATPQPAPQPQPDDDGDDDNMNTAQYTDLRDRLKAIDTKLEQVLDALDEMPTMPDPGTDPPDPGTPTDPSDPAISSIQFLDPPEVASWKQTSKITSVTIKPISGKEEIAQVCIEHTKLGVWPEKTPGGVTVEGCPWVIFDTPSGLVGCTYEWYRPKQACKLFYIGNLHRTVRGFWPIKSGQRVGFMSSTLARDANRSINERSDVFWTRWP